MFLCDSWFLNSVSVLICMLMGCFGVLLCVGWLIVLCGSCVSVMCGWNGWWLVGMLSLYSSVVSFVFSVMYVVLIVSFVMISFVCGRFGYYVICLIGIGGNVCVVVSVGRCVVSVLYCFCLIVLMNVSVMCSCVGGGCCVLWVIGNVCSVLCDVVLGISVMNVWSWLLFMICVLLCVFWLLCWLMVDVVVVGCVCFICWLVVCV